MHSRNIFMTFLCIAENQLYCFSSEIKPNINLKTKVFRNPMETTNISKYKKSFCIVTNKLYFA